MPKYSIITPVYNSFHLMNRYFESLNNQTYTNFEVILVDDCSSDDSFEKLKEYSKNTRINIQVYQTDKNAGPGNARNIGMDNANGEWITFIDNDDWVDADLLEKINLIIEKENVNCVIYDYYITSGEDKKIAGSMFCGKTGIIPVSDCMIYARNHTVGKFYKLSDCTENGIRFPHLRRCEDVAFVCRAIDACGSVYYFKEAKYYYYQRKSSLSNNENLDETDMIKAFGILEETLGSKYPVELKEKSITDLFYGVLLMMCKSSKNNKTIRNYINNYCEKYPGWEKCEIINHLGMAKKVFLKAAQYKMIFLLKILTFIHTKLIG